MKGGGQEHNPHAFATFGCVDCAGHCVAEVIEGQNDSYNCSQSTFALHTCKRDAYVQLPLFACLSRGVVRSCASPCDHQYCSREHVSQLGALGFDPIPSAQPCTSNSCFNVTASKFSSVESASIDLKCPAAACMQDVITKETSRT